jgi:hypothetical protein
MVRSCAARSSRARKRPPYSLEYRSHFLNSFHPPTCFSGAISSCHTWCNAAWFLPSFCSSSSEKRSCMHPKKVCKYLKRTRREKETCQSFHARGILLLVPEMIHQKRCFPSSAHHVGDSRRIPSMLSSVGECRMQQEKRILPVGATVQDPAGDRYVVESLLGQGGLGAARRTCSLSKRSSTRTGTTALASPVKAQSLNASITKPCPVSTGCSNKTNVSGCIY